MIVAMADLFDGPDDGRPGPDRGDRRPRRQFGHVGHEEVGEVCEDDGRALDDDVADHADQWDERAQAAPTQMPSVAKRSFMARTP